MGTQSLYGSRMTNKTMVVLPEEVGVHLARQANQHGMTMSGLIRHITIDWLQKRGAKFRTLERKRKRLRNMQRRVA
jgi:hypothetical protein